jgi:hypothetical protein
VRSTSQIAVIIAILVSTIVEAKTGPSGKSYIPPRVAIEGIRIGQPQDSTESIFRKIALRRQFFSLDSLRVMESDSVSIFDQPAYIQIQFLRGRVRTIIINFHPLPGDGFLSTRKTLLELFEKTYGRGVPSSDLSVQHRRWETEDGTHEISYSDKYGRLFIRLGKR